MNSKEDPKHYHTLCTILWGQYLLLLHEPILTAVDTITPITLQNSSREPVIIPFKNMYMLFFSKDWVSILVLFTETFILLFQNVFLPNLYNIIILVSLMKQCSSNPAYSYYFS